MEENKKPTEDVVKKETTTTTKVEVKKEEHVEAEKPLEKYNKKVVVVGSGAFGTAIAECLVRKQDNKNKIIVYGVNAKEVNDINNNHKNSRYYSLRLSPNLKATTDPKDAFKDADIILLALPSQFLKTSLQDTIIPNLEKPAYFVNLAKGFDYLNVDILSSVIKETVPKEKSLGILKLSGASFAQELIYKQPTAFILAADDIATSEEIYKELSNETMKVIPSDQLEAVEWISVIKNPLAILMGIVSGLGYKTNTKAMFFVQAVNDMRKVLKSLGLDDSKVLSPAGIGDLFLTGTSMKSRNFSTGYAIGKADKVTNKTLQMFTTTEGLRSVEILTRLSRTNKLNLKTMEMLYNITYKKEQPSKVIKNYINKF